MSPRPLPRNPAARWSPAVTAVALLGAVLVAGVAGGIGTGGEAAPTTPTSGTVVDAVAPVAPTLATSVVNTTVTFEPTTVAPAATRPATSRLASDLRKGTDGEEVAAVQQRLTELGFDPGPPDGAFGDLTRAAVWAFEKLVLQVPRSEATGVVTDEMWQRMQEPLVVQPRRASAGTANHTEIYLPEQVVVYFQDDRAVLISHMSSGSDTEWCDVVTISPGEYGNVEGTEPLERHECGRSNTPGGVYQYDREVDGVRQSGLGGMWNPMYFNYGIAIHGGLQVPLEPTSHGCIRVPMEISEKIQDVATVGDRVWVWDGEQEPEHYGPQLPTFNWLDPAFATTTTTTSSPSTVTATPSSTTSATIATPG